MSAAFQQAMESLTAFVFKRLFPQLPQEKWPNSANLDLYANGRQGVGWHADDENMFGGKYSDCFHGNFSELIQHSERAGSMYSMFFRPDEGS